MSGCAPLVIPPDWHQTVVDLRHRLVRGRSRLLTADDLRAASIELRAVYFTIEEVECSIECLRFAMPPAKAGHTRI